MKIAIRPDYGEEYVSLSLFFLFCACAQTGTGPLNNYCYHDGACIRRVVDTGRGGGVVAAEFAGKRPRNAAVYRREETTTGVGRERQTDLSL